MNIILSIHPKWAEKIYSGEKTVEWRRNSPRNYEYYTVYLYETAPVKKITGYFNFVRFEPINVNNPYNHEYLCQLIEQGKVSKEDLVKYQGNKSQLVAWIIDEKFGRFEQPLTISDFGLKRAQQSWQYVEVDNG